MKVYAIIVLFGVSLSAPLVLSQNLSFVKIGNQEWMVRNLEVTTFRNGEVIPHAKTPEEWEKAANEGKPAWCYYDNNADNGKTYGKLYNWHAVDDPRELAPAGWRVPTDDDWSTMTKHLGGETGAGKKIKASSGWPKGKNGTNSSGLTILPGGCRHAHGKFYGTPNLAYLWTATANNDDNAWYRTVSADFDKIYRHGSLNKGSGFSVRCVKN